MTSDKPSTNDLMKSPQFNWRTRYTTLYILRFQHHGWERNTAKGFAASDREIGRGDWEVPMPVKVEPELEQVHAEVGEYVGAAGSKYLKVYQMDGKSSIDGDTDAYIGQIESVYWKRMRWKYMTLPFVNYMLKQAGLRR